ncbi:T9SS type A sorting domain-containing protein [Roseivirga sp.]|uniref:T9SS type A sorting domain-containing protein n=1 Tax=Roseivirga sp. TaxID=1964215 RepID=UPI003B8D3C38
MRVVLTFLFTFLFIARCFSQVDELNDYATLFQYNGSADSINIKHPRYHGLFVKSGCTETNYGTRFNLASGCWQRVHDNYSPRFWEIGGLSPANGIGVVVKEADAINSAAYTAWLAGGGTIEITGMYEIDRSIWLLENNTYLGMTDSSGFYRETPPKTILTHSTAVNDKQIYVKSNKGFRTRHRINIASDQNYDSLAGFVSYTASIASDPQNDTTIFLSGRSIREVMQPGDSVSLFFPLMEGVSWAEADNIKVDNLVLNGNSHEYTLNYDWRVNTTIIFPTNTGSVIDKCRFYNSASENIFLCGTNITNSSGEDFNGSAIHFSCSAKGGPTEVLYNEFSNLNKIGNDVMQHSEAALTFSSRVRNFRVSYNRLSELNELGMGLISNDDSAFVITDNIIETENQEIGFRPFYRYDSTNVVYNNKNPLKANTSSGSCFLAIPKPVGESACSAFSSFDKPLEMGQLINIPLDSIYMINSNENYVKGIFFQYDNEYFDLVGADMFNPTLAKNHEWVNEVYDEQEGIVFNNGYKGGSFVNGNWGYEPCGEAGGCNRIRIYFKVKKLPAITSAVACPIKGLRIVYDGDMATWNSPVLCENKVIELDQEQLGQPIILGVDQCPQPTNLIAEVINQTTVDLKWTGQEGASKYLLFFKAQGQSKWNKQLVTGAESVVLNRLGQSTTYTWKVKSQCGESWGQFSDENDFRIEAEACGQIEFNQVSVEPIEEDRARINWKNKNSYRTNIRWRKSGVSDWKLISTQAASRRWIGSLETGTSYDFQIRAVCLVGGALEVSPWSSIKNFTTLSIASTSTNVASESAIIQAPELIEEISVGLQIIPNPANSEVRLVTSDSIIKSVKVLDLSGKEVFYKRLGRNSEAKISLSKMSPGIYLLRVFTDKRRYFKRLLIEK